MLNADARRSLVCVHFMSLFAVDMHVYGDVQKLIFRNNKKQQQSERTDLRQGSGCYCILTDVRVLAQFFR